MAAPKVIDLSTDTLRARILPFGASLVGLRFGDTPRNLVLGFADPADHARVPIYAGGIVGPVANRVRAGQVTLDGTPYQMPLNEGGKTALHSGDDGLHTRTWNVVALSTGQVTLTCALPDGHAGLPGNRRFVAHYALEGSSLTLTLSAQSDQATPMNLAAHPYWNLDGTADLSGHRIDVAADSFLPTDADNLPTGQITPVAGTPFDFRSAVPVPLTPDLDVNFCLADHMRQTPHFAANLTGADGTTLEIATNAAGLQIYNGGFLPVDAPPTDGFPALAPYAGIALEPQHWPDAPNQPSFPQITLQPGEIFTQITRYTLSNGAI